MSGVTMDDCTCTQHGNPWFCHTPFCPVRTGVKPQPRPEAETYLCPTSGEMEHPTLGGFDVCCDDPACPSSRKHDEQAS